MVLKLITVHRYQKPDYQALRYHSAPKKKKTVGSLDEIDPEMRAAWDKLGIPIGEQVTGHRHRAWTSQTHSIQGCVWARSCAGLQ